VRKCVIPIAWALLRAGALSAQESPVFRTDVSLVHVDAGVVADGRIVTGLTKGDFVIKDEAEPQAIVHFAAEDEPLDLILLFDTSGSMMPAISKVAAAGREALNELRAGDRVAVSVFSFRSRIILPFTEDFAVVERTIREDVAGKRFGGGTFIQNAVDNAARQFMSQPRTQRRRAVLIITDDIGQRTRSTGPIVRDFWEADALLSELIVGKRTKAARIIAPVFAPHLAVTMVGVGGIVEKTGGDAIQAGDPGSGFRDMIHRIRSRYSLYYSQPAGKPGTTRTIHVELSADAASRYPNARVRSRTGYVVPPAK
jgi:Mg-chelatase subunit ChlD